MNIKDVDSIILENKRRRQELFSPYNPVTGEGSPIERVRIGFTALGHYMQWGVPVQMYNDHKALLDQLVAQGSVKNLLKSTGKINHTLAESQFIKDLTEIRFKYDFEFWAIVCAKVQDKDTKKIIPFKLNKPQRKTLAAFEKARMEGLPIRTIILKARQWGGSTLTQVYMAWIQLIHKMNWHSTIVADVENQARNIRGMYTRLAKEYNTAFGNIKLVPYEGSSSIRMIDSRNCIVAIGSVQKPESLRSYDFAMTHLCLAPGTLIPVEDGFLKEVKHCYLGDKLLTHTGHSSFIKSISCSRPSKINGNGKAISINPWLGHEVILTPNHPVFTKRGWVPAGELVKSDWLSMPVREITDEIKSIQLPYYPQRKRGGGIRPKGNGSVISINQEVGFAFGYYLAEGSVHKKPNQRIGFSEIAFVRHDKEEAYGDRAVAALLPYAGKHFRKKRLGVQTTVEVLYGSILARWIYDELGSKDFKRIPDWFFNCGKDFLAGVLQGYLSGDGNKSNGRQGHVQMAGIMASTISSSIATQIRDIAASLGLGWGSIDIREAGIHYGRNCQKIYIVRWAGKAARRIRELLCQEYPNNGHTYSEKYELSDKYIWFKIKDIKESKLDWVYDIEVSHTDHSFRTLYFSVKNSEVGSWKSTAQRSAEDLVQNLRATVPDVPYSLAVLESTAKGVGNFFHREWLAAKDGKTSYVPVFIPWFEIERYQKGIANHEAFIKSLEKNDYAHFLWDLGATLEGIKWYFDFKNGENYDDWRMFNEFPSTDTEAFSSSDRRAFAPRYVQAARKNKLTPEYIGDLVGEALRGEGSLSKIEFQPDSKGNLYIWSKPDRSINVSDRYLVSVDIGGRWHGADYSVIRVIDRYWMAFGGKPEIVATWRGHLDQDLVAWKAAQIAAYYNDALLIVESNSLDNKNSDSEGNHFLTILDEIVKFYPNIYARTDPEKVRQGLPIKYGFQTNLNTKPMVIDLLNACLREESYVERDARACDEMDTYELKDNGTYGATEGCHDDIVMATAIGLWACFKYMPVPVEIKYTGPRTTNKIISEATI